MALSRVVRSKPSPTNNILHPASWQLMQPQGNSLVQRVPSRYLRRCTSVDQANHGKTPYTAWCSAWRSVSSSCINMHRISGPIKESVCEKNCQKANRHLRKQIKLAAESGRTKCTASS
eukprot:scpid37592/ scgid34930/ 